MTKIFIWLAFGLALTLRAQPQENKGLADIGSRVEMFVDDWLIDSKRNVCLQLQTPIRREVVLVTDKPWEGPRCAYFSVFQDGSRIRLYYRGANPGLPDWSDQMATCYAESGDGIHFDRPNLGLYEFQGSKQNNIVYRGVEAENFAAFADGNPGATPTEHYKALGGRFPGLYALCSPDGIHWRKMQGEPISVKVLVANAFDSQNVAFWDEVAKCYRGYFRYMTDAGVRAIQNCTSKDFLHWTDAVPNRYRGVGGVELDPVEHFYTSATVPCPGAPHIYLAFPKRFMPERQKFSDYPAPGVSDAVFMSSRDGLTWDRTFSGAWLRPGPDPHNWTQRCNMTAWGIVQSDPAEFSLYVSEHYMWPDNRLRRVTVRRHGFAFVHADAAGGEFTTRPVTFSGQNLILNYATSAVGSVQTEIEDETGKVLPGFSLADMNLLFGDELDAVVTWKGGKNLSELIGKAVRFRFVLKDADIFALRTGEASK
jgi:hypothetical protein